jgi:hypothetical protein
VQGNVPERVDRLVLPNFPASPLKNRAPPRRPTSTVSSSTQTTLTREVLGRIWNKYLAAASSHRRADCCLKGTAVSALSIVWTSLVV